MKRCFTVFSLVFLLSVHFMPFAAFAAKQDAPPNEPYQKSVAQKGNWYVDRFTFGGKSNLAVGYEGNFKTKAAGMELDISLSEKILLTGICIPFEGVDFEDVELSIVDSNGNVYQGFSGERMILGGTGTAEKDGRDISGPGNQNTLYIFTPQARIPMPQGKYQLKLSGDTLPIDAYLLKGYHYAAYETYQNALRQWINDELEKEELYVSIGDDLISAAYEQPGYDEYFEYYEPPEVFYAPIFSLDREYVIDQIILSTWNDGQGAFPGNINIMNEQGEVIAAYPAQGADRNGVANAMWVIFPDLQLDAGLYFIDLNDPGIMDYDSEGVPVFHIEASVPALPETNFTGTYKIWLDLYKSDSLAGALKEQERSFFLEDYQLIVLDKGEVIELIGDYEGMTFSQNCDVVERNETELVAYLDFSADFTKLPQGVMVSANAKVSLKKESGGRITVSMTGQGRYIRAASEEAGEDRNTYLLSLRGGQTKSDLPPVVLAAIGRTYGAGNIPGPDTPYQAAAGMLFPPLAGLLTSMIQSLIKPKKPSVVLTSEEPLVKLSVGEKAMRDANRSLGKGLYTEEEARAWAILGDALGASGGDPEDAISIGDNERGAQIDTDTSADYEEPSYSEEDLSFGKPDQTANTYGEYTKEDRPGHAEATDGAYKEGGTYGFDDGVIYEYKNGAMQAVRGMEYGERYTLPDGEARIWFGTDSRNEAEWLQQAATNKQYTDAQREEWARVSATADKYTTQAFDELKDVQNRINQMESLLDKIQSGRVSVGNNEKRINTEISDFLEKTRETLKIDQSELDKIRISVGYDLKLGQKKDLAEMMTAHNKAFYWDVATKTVETTKTVADASIEALAKVTGPQGKYIEHMYKVVSTTAGGISEGMCTGDWQEALTTTGAGIADIYLADMMKTEKSKAIYKVFSGAVKGGYAVGKEAYGGADTTAFDVVSATARGMLEGGFSEASGLLKDSLKGKAKVIYTVADKAAKGAYGSFIEGGDTYAVLEGAVSKAPGGVAEVLFDSAFDRLIPKSKVVDGDVIAAHQWEILKNRNLDENPAQTLEKILPLDQWKKDVLKNEFRSFVKSNIKGEVVSVADKISATTDLGATQTIWSGANAATAFLKSKVGK